MKLLWVMLLSVLMACAGTNPHTTSNHDSMTICVVNESMDAFALKHEHRSYGSLYPGQHKLITLSYNSMVRSRLLTAHNITGASDANVRHPGTFSQRWIWTILNNPIINQSGLQPARGRTPCD